MQVQLIVGLVITALVILWVYMRRTNKGGNLPAVSEDVNLPAASKVEPPVVSQTEPPTSNELENKGPQQ